jgi:hypothetical protein
MPRIFQVIRKVQVVEAAPADSNWTENADIADAIGTVLLFQPDTASVEDRIHHALVLTDESLSAGEAIRAALSSKHAEAVVLDELLRHRVRLAETVAAAELLGPRVRWPDSLAVGDILDALNVGLAETGALADALVGSAGLAESILAVDDWHGTLTGRHIFTASGSWVAPSIASRGFDVTAAKFEVWAAGGNGGNATAVNKGAGAGGGGYSRLNAHSTTPGNSYSLTVGQPGASRDSSVVNTATLLAKGGSPGGTGSGTAGQGGQAAQGVGDAKFSGGNGGDGAGSLGQAGGGGGGAGASSGGGTGGLGQVRGGGGGGGNITGGAGGQGARGEGRVTYTVQL